MDCLVWYVHFLYRFGYSGAEKMCGLGLILAFVFTAVFFVWQNHTRKDLLWQCFKNAIKWSFAVMSVISFLFRPLYEGGRYAGIFTNPNTFGLYLYIIIAVFCRIWTGVWRPAGLAGKTL